MQTEMPATFLDRLFANLEAFCKDNPGITLILVALAWVMCHPWFGFWHDGMLYLGQTLHVLSPKNYIEDVFFQFGSQDEYTIFTKIYAPLISLLGVSAAAQILMLSAQMFWISSFIYLLQAIFNKNPLAIAIACFIAMALPAFYGSDNIFSYGEPFLTARSFAEPLVLLGLALILRQRLVSALLVFLLSALFHPLIALTSLLVWFCHIVVYPPSRKIRWAGLATATVGVAMIVTFAFCAIKPFSNLLNHYDKSWFELAFGFNMNVFLMHWRANDWAPKAGAFLLYILYIKNSSHRAARKLFNSIFFAALIALPISYIFGEQLRNVFILSIQAWRVLWLFQLIIPSVVCAWIFAERHELSLTVKWSAALATLTILMQSYTVKYGFFASALALAYLPTPVIRPSLTRIINLALIVTILIALISRAFIESAFVALQFRETTFQVFYPHITVVGCALVLFYLMSLARNKNVVLILLLSFALLAIFTWDRRGPQNHLFDTSQNTNPFTPLIPAGDVVFWNTQMPLSWLIFNRASYINGMTSAAVLFNRQFAYEYALRYSRAQDQYVRSGCPSDKYGRGFCVDTKKNINPDLCRIDGRIKWIVSGFRSDLPSAAHWAFSMPDYPDGLYLYSCKTWLKL